MGVRGVALLLCCACGSKTDLETIPVAIEDGGIDADVVVPDVKPPPACRSDAECDDHLFCTGVERCDPIRGCMTSPPQCDDGIACTNDACDETKRTCAHQPDDSKCPISHACDPKNGCEQRAFAHSQLKLYDVRLPSGKVIEIGNTDAALTDIALHPNNTLYGFSYQNFYTVNQATGHATFVATLADSINGADVSPLDGTMYVAGTSSLYTLDVVTHALAFVTSFPNNDVSSGDLAFVGTKLMATAHGGMNVDELVQFDLATKSGTIVGNIGVGCVWALAAYGSTLYGMSCSGDIIAIDPSTAVGKTINHANANFWGAPAR